MQGRRSGLATKIRNEVPAVVPVHCLAHCLNLCLQDAGWKLITVETLYEIHQTTHDEYGFKAAGLLSALEKFSTLFRVIWFLEHLKHFLTPCRVIGYNHFSS